MKSLFVVAAVFVAGYAWGAGGSHGEHAEIPTQQLIAQVVNFTALIILLSYLMRKAVPAYFNKRISEFKELTQKATQAKVKAEAQKREISDRLQKLQSTAGDSLKQVEAEAEQLRRRLIQEAKDMAAKMKNDAEQTARHELEKAKNDLRQELIASAMNMAQKSMREQVEASDQKRLQIEFVEKIQVVQ